MFYNIGTRSHHYVPLDFFEWKYRYIWRQKWHQTGINVVKCHFLCHQSTFIGISLWKWEKG